MTRVLLTTKLRDAGITNLTILEKPDGLSGTGRENTNPGVARDIPHTFPSIPLNQTPN